MQNLMTIKSREEIKFNIVSKLAPFCSRVVVTVSPVGRVNIFVETSTRELANVAFENCGFLNIGWTESSWGDDNKTPVLWSVGITYNL